MTREEAIERLRKMLTEAVEFEDSVCYVAEEDREREPLEMAIKALEQEPCEDWCDVPSDEMTLEQARQAVKDLRKKLAEYLMKDTCEDCISRVLEYIEGSNAELGHSSENELVCQHIKELLPVIPQKTGRWIKGNSYGDQYNYYQSYVCSCCKRECGDVHGWKYCPNCGIKMEVEENERN